MRKLRVLLVAVLAVFILAACGGSDNVLENKDKDYYVTGQWNGWGAFEGYEMEAIKLSDERVKSIKGQLKGVEALYIKEVTLPAEDAGWENTFKIDGEEVTFNGNLAVKVIRTTKGDPDAKDFWAPAKESGKITNLTPDTFFLPEFREEDAEEDGKGTWADNPFAKEAGVYYVIYAEKGAGVNAERFMGLIKK